MITDWMRALALGATFPIGRAAVTKAPEGARERRADRRALSDDKGDLRHDRREHGRR